MANSFTLKNPAYLILFMRSLVFSFFMILASTIYSFFCVLAFPLPLRFRYKMITAWTGTVLWVLEKVCKINYEINGLEHIAHIKNGIVFSKHQSTWETFFLPRLFNLSAIILKRELLWIPFFGWGLAIIKPIAINRQSTQSALEQIIQQGKICLEQGRWILVFPEGTRVSYGTVGKYHLGGAKLAVATEYPVVPIAHNAGKFWARRKFIKYPGTIQVIIGPSIDPKNKKADEVLSEAKNWIEGKMVEL